MLFNRRRGDAFKTQYRIVFSQSLLNGVAHDVAELLPGAGHDFQKAFVLNDFQQRREMLRFQQSDGQMTNCRKDMIFITGKMRPA